MFIRVNIDYKESIAIIEKIKTNNIFIIENIFFERKFHVSISNIDVS